MSGTAASVKPGRRPFRVFASSVNWLTSSSSSLTFRTDRLNFPSASSKIRSSTILRVKYSISAHAQKLAYDLASQITSFLEYMPADKIVEIARKYYPCEDLMAAAKYLDIIQRRPDIVLTNENKKELLRLMNLKIKRSRFRRTKRT